MVVYSFSISSQPLSLSLFIKFIFYQYIWDLDFTIYYSILQTWEAIGFPLSCLLLLEGLVLNQQSSEKQEYTGKKNSVAAAIGSEDERIREARERIKVVKGRNIDAEHRTLFSRVDELAYTFIGSRHCFRTWTSCMSKHYTFNSLQNSLELNSIDDEDSS